MIKENGGQSSARNAGIDYFSSECNFGNSSLELHSADSANFECSQTPSLVSHSKFAENYESQTENPSVVLNANSAESSLRGKAEAIHKNKKIDCHESADADSRNDESCLNRHDSPLQNLVMTICAQNLTLYHNAESTTNPPKIDYIIFLDSDDFWELDLLEKCVDSALKHNAQIVWFRRKTFYDGIDNPSVNGGGESTWLGIYGYTQEGVISNVDWFNRAKERNLYFANGWHIFTQFSHLQATNLRYLEGVIWEDVLFAELLFAQSERIVILPEMLVNYRVRQNNTTNFGGVKQKNCHHL